jgi:hypothetical protein
MTKWDGHERRKQQKGNKTGRRGSDEHCGQHAILWENNEKSRAEYRETTCGKIKEVKNNISIEVDKLEKVDAAISTKIDEMNKIIVGKFWFRIVIGAMFASLIYIAGQNSLSNRDQTEALKSISKDQKEVVAVVNSIENKQIEIAGQIKIFEKEISDLNKRQDVLRDAHLKIVQEKK